MKPPVSLIHIDPSRVGGAFTSHRHAFGMAPQAREMPQETVAAPPPKRVLAQGRPTSPEISQAEIASFQRDLGEIAEALKLELEAVKAEADTVSGKDLGASGLYRAIPVVGGIFEPSEIRNQVVLDSNAIGNAAERALSGSASPYLTDAQRETLQTVAADARALAGYVKQFPVASPEGRLVMFADEHTGMHVAPAEDLLAAVERRVVIGEAASVPVKEPGEGIPAGGLLALAILVVVGGILVYEFA